VPADTISVGASFEIPNNERNDRVIRSVAMTVSDRKNPVLQCPSAPENEPGAVIFGVVTGTPEKPRIGYLTEAQPVTESLLALAGQAKTGQVFRTAAPCMGNDCKHFDGSDCRLVQRIAAFLDPVVSGLPACDIRPTCRWFRQEGKAACIRCPQVITATCTTDQYELWVADPDNVDTRIGIPENTPPAS
jgi:hypothetical protein